MIVVGLPSRAYSSWFFGSGYRRYPLLYSHYNNYYNFHRGGYGNVYRGFNYSAREHFNPGYRGASGRGYASQGRTVNRTVNNNVNVNRNTTVNRNTNVRTNQMHVSPANVNNRGMQQFHASTYHSMGWQNVGGTSHSSGSFRSSGGGGGGGRSGGGGGRSGGGGRH